MTTLSQQSWAIARGHWFAGNIPYIRRNPLSVFSHLRRQHGDYVKVCVVPSIDCYLLAHPSAVEHVLVKNPKNYRKPDRLRTSLGLLIGNGVFTSEGPTWARQRRMTQPALQGSHLDVFASVMVKAAEDFIEEQLPHAGEPIEMVQAMMRLTLRIAGTTLFSADITGKADHLGQAFRRAFVHVSRRLNSLQMLPPWMPTPGNLRFNRSKRLLDQAVIDMIVARQKMTEKPHDLLTLLSSAHDEASGEAMLPRLLVDEVLTLLTAGHETMWSALVWTWYLLATHPDVQEQLFDQVHAKLRGGSPTPADLEAMPLARAVFEESLRLYPPAWGELRESIAEDEIDGRPIPAKATLVLCQWVTHRHPDFWSEPNEFRPQRFLDEAPSGGASHRFAYFPFGGGPRVCMGMAYALLEGPLLLASIIQRFRVKLVDDRPVIPDATFVLRPKGGLRLLLQRR